MAQAKQALEELSADPEAQRLAIERAAALKFYAMDLDASREEGRQEGRQEGRKRLASMLVKQLTLKFGTLTDKQKARIDAASSDDLEHYLERVLPAPSIDEVLSP